MSNEATPDVLHIVHVLTLVKVELNIYGQHNTQMNHLLLCEQLVIEAVVQ